VLMTANKIIMANFAQVLSPPPSAILLTNPQRLLDGSLRFGFTNKPYASFTVLTATNLALPLNNWSVLGPVPEASAGEYQFTDPQTTNAGERFYRVRSP